MNYPNLERFDHLPHYKNTKKINRIAAAIEPIERSTLRIPLEKQRSVVELSEKIGGPAAAFVYNVSYNSVKRWRRQFSLRNKKPS